MRYLFAVAVLTGLLVPGAHAQDDVYAAGMTAAITVGRYHTDFRYPAADYRTDFSRYTVVVTQPVSHNADFGFEGAYLVGSVDSPALVNLDAGSGHSLGVFLRWQPRLGQYLGLQMQAGYRWNNALFSSAAGQPEVNWYEGYLSAGPALHIRNWIIGAGLRWQHIDGRETDPGPVAQHWDFKAARAVGAYLSLTCYLDPTGSVALQAYGGGQRGAELVFQRRF